MISPLQLTLLATALASSATAHFSIIHPKELGHSSETSPCGEGALSLAETSEFFVGGEAVALKTSHPEVHILIRATLDADASSNWTNLHPVVKQEGLGGFCQPLIKAPEEWVGKKGYLQIVQSGEDGLLYACAAVTFHGERAASATTLCSNGTGVTGEFSSDPRLPSDGLAFGALPNSDDDQDGDDNDDDAPAATSGGTPAATSEAAAASSTVADSGASRLMGVGAIGAAILGAALMI